MNNLDKLASICSVLLESYSDEDKSSSKSDDFDNNKSKTSVSVNFTCVDEMRNLHPKVLVEKFSEFTSDEIKRRYSYKCRILLNECEAVFESYGSEKKACDNMKHHLQLHLHDIEERISNGTWSTEISENKSSPTQKSKGCKRSLKSEHPLGIKMPRKKNCRSKKTPPSERVGSNGLRKPPKLRPPELGGKPNSITETKHSGFIVNTQSEPKKEVVEEIVQDLTVEICGPLCSHVNCSLSQPSTSSKSKPSAVIFSDLLVVQSIALEHSYASKEGVKSEEAPLPKSSKTTNLSSGRKRKGCCISTDLVIKTPPFPYVHVPLLPDCSGIELVIMEGVSCEEIIYSVQEASSSDTCEESPIAVKHSIKRAKKHHVPSSVLECVENRVDVNVSSIRVPNSPSRSPEHSNEENAENVQKAEREKALRCITKLKAKKKKQYQGPLECQICKHKKFTALATLIHHYRSHAGIKPYSCKLCEGTFTRKHSLNYHMLIHRNISRFTCPSCYRAFRHPSHYKEHLRRHTGETPFVCPTCLLKFKTRNTFKRHLKIQHRKLLTARGILDLPSLDE